MVRKSSFLSARGYTARHGALAGERGCREEEMWSRVERTGREGRVRPHPGFDRCERQRPIPDDCDNYERAGLWGASETISFSHSQQSFSPNSAECTFSAPPSHSASAYPSGDERPQALTRLYGSLAVAVPTFVRYL
jgi:hypothetical protein